MGCRIMSYPFVIPSHSLVSAAKRVGARSRFGNMEVCGFEKERWEAKVPENRTGIYGMDGIIGMGLAPKERHICSPRREPGVGICQTNLSSRGAAYYSLYSLW